MSSKGWSFPVMCLRNRHFMNPQLKTRLESIKAKVLTPRPFASTTVSFSIFAPSEVRMMPFSQSRSTTLVARLSLTGWPFVASRCLSNPVWRSPCRRKRKLAPYLSGKSFNESCHVVWAVAPSRCRIFVNSVSGPRVPFRTYLESFDPTNSLQVETPVVIYLPRIRCDG